MMRIGLLRCDEIFEDLRPRYEGYHRLFTDLFGAVRPDVSFVDYPVVEGTLPGSADEQDAWLITGSVRGVYEDEPWIHDLLDLVRDLDAARAPTNLLGGHFFVIIDKVVQVFLLFYLFFLSYKLLL